MQQQISIPVQRHNVCPPGIFTSDWSRLVWLPPLFGTLAVLGNLQVCLGNFDRKWASRQCECPRLRSYLLKLCLLRTLPLFTAATPRLCPNQETVEFITEVLLALRTFLSSSRRSLVELFLAWCFSLGTIHRSISAPEQNSKTKYRLRTSAPGSLTFS